MTDLFFADQLGPLGIEFLNFVVERYLADRGET
jgi:hypothetical protein